MRLPPHGALASVVAGILLAACVEPQAPATPDPSQIVLRNGDVPAGLQRCPGSGDLDGYLSKQSNPAARDEVAAAWSDMRRQGAARAALAVYAAQLSACGARFGAGEGMNVSSLVIQFASDSSASAAFGRGILGFTTPGQDEEIDGLVYGAATGLGHNAWRLERRVGGRATLVAYWQRHTIAALVVAVDEDPLHAQQSLSAVDGRIA